MVPIYQAPAIVPHAVLEEEKQIIREFGWYHVGDRYYANAADADKMRRLEAERRVSDRERLTCAFCFEKITGNVAVIIAMRAVHPSCAKEFDAWVSSKPEENDPRWSTVTAETPVLFDGEMTTWSDLAGNERMMCTFGADGVLVGGMAF
jgi:hypothetical protein